MLVTRLTRSFGIDHPIIQAGMGAEAGPELAAAVSTAGGLGTIGTIATPPDEVQMAIRRCRDLTAMPFAVNMVTFEGAPHRDEIIDVVLREKPAVVTLSFGDPVPTLRLCREHGIKTLVQVQDFATARAVLAAGPDALIVQGNEAGGHTGRRGTLSFLAQALAIAGDTPVVAAGGIADGRGLAAVLAMGASGALVGTRFKASVEYGCADIYKDVIAASDGDNTVGAPFFDAPYPFKWPANVVGRAFRNAFTAEWEGRDEELKAAVEALPPFGFLQRLWADPEQNINWAGESAGLVGSVLPAAEIVRTMVEEAEELLRRAASVVVD
jgi:nitronate monooxygenase